MHVGQINGDRFEIERSESPSLSVHSSINRIDQIFDDVDVGQCEIPWEDLVLVKRLD